MIRTIYNSGQKSQNVSERVYSILYKNIVNLNLIPGTLMSEKEVSEMIQVSRTPVREAFIKLSKDALVNIIPQKGTFVSKIDLGRVQEERFLRESLEFFVLEDFMQSYTDHSMDKLLKNLKKQKEALLNQELTKFIGYDDQFHAILFDDAKKSLCYDVILNFSSHYRRIRYLSMSISGVSNENIIQHEELVESIKAKDVNQGQKILKKHLRKLIIEEDKICEKYPDYFERSHDNSKNIKLDMGDNIFLKNMQKENFIKI